MSPRTVRNSGDVQRNDIESTGFDLYLARISLTAGCLAAFPEASEATLSRRDDEHVQRHVVEGAGDGVAVLRDWELQQPQARHCRRRRCRTPRGAAVSQAAAAPPLVARIEAVSCQEDQDRGYDQDWLGDRIG